MTRFPLTVICASLLTLSVASAQDDQPRVFAGGPAIYGLQISLDRLKLESADLVRRIRQIPPLTVLLIPPPERKWQPAERIEPNATGVEEPEYRYPIDFCLPGETVLLRMYVGEHDHEALTELARDPTFLSAATIRTIVSELPPDQQQQPLDEALAKVASLPRAKQVEARYRIGQMMADLAPENARIQAMVLQYRTKVEQEVIARVTGVDGSDFARGKLYQFGGPWRLTEQQILTIDPKQVRTVQVNGNTYKFAWIGDKMLMVADPDPSTVAVDPTGLGLQGIERLNVAIRPEVLDAPRRGVN